MTFCMGKENAMKSKGVQSILIFLAAAIFIGANLAVMSIPAQAGGQRSTSQVVTIAGSWSGAEQGVFQDVLDEYTLRFGVATSYTFNSNISEFLLNCAASGTCPDVAIVSMPGLIGQLAEQDDLTPLDPIIPDFDTNFNAKWRSLASVGDTLYGVPLKVMTKSIIWYRPQAFQEITATSPVSWTQLLSLSDALVADGQIPFSIGAESGAASGWPLSDWFENILVRVAGPDVDRKLVTHDIAWTDPGVVASMQKFTEIFGQGDYQLGGITGTLETNFNNALLTVFAPTHSAAMYFEGSWVQGIIVATFPTLLPVQDYNFFEFPEINSQFGKPVVGSADFAVLFNNSAAAQDLIRFLATLDAAEIWIAHIGYLSPNIGINLSSYPDELSRRQAELLTGTSDFLFDLDDQLPHDLQVYVWNALMDYVANPDHLLGILRGIEAEATKEQGPVFAGYLPLTVK